MVTLRHRKTATIPDFTQIELNELINRGAYPAGTTLADIVLTSDWNNDHDMTELNNTIDDLESTVIMLMGC